MSTVKEIEHAIVNLKPEEISKFRVWYEEFDAALWDKEFENDVKSGKLDDISNKAIEDFNKGKFKEL